MEGSEEEEGARDCQILYLAGELLRVLNVEGNYCVQEVQFGF